MTEITLRDSTPNDEQFVNQLTRRTMQRYVEATWDDEKAREHYYEENRFHQPTTQIIQYEGKDVGRLSVTRSEDKIFIDELHILPEYQSHGIGSTIFRRLVEEANQRGVPVEFMVLKTNPAKKLYDRLGFKVIRQDDERYYVGTTA